MSSLKDDIRVAVAIDFGTTFSGYAYAHKSNQKEINVEKKWGAHIEYKAPTIIKYEDDMCSTIKSWGFDALPEKPKRKRNIDNSKPVELFKLSLLKDSQLKLPILQVDYKKVITDYLEKLSVKIKERLNIVWPNLDFYNQVLIVFMIPTGFDDEAISIMHECIFHAGLIGKDSMNLVFITEPEAAAICCLDPLEKLHNLKPGDSFMVVDCGGGTVDLTCHELLTNNKISEITKRTGGNCGSSFVDKEFINFLRRKLGNSTVETLEKNHYNALQFMVLKFSRKVKIRFTGEELDLRYEIDLDEYPWIKDIIEEGKEKKSLKESDWSIFVKYDDVKGMFDDCITKIIQLIRGQLRQLALSQKKCSAMMLVGGFSESKYLQSRIKNEFNKIISNITVPQQPVTAVVKGGVQYGFRPEAMTNRRKMPRKSDIRVVVGLDFGTTYSGFTYCHVSKRKDIHTNKNWPPGEVNTKTNTVLQYDSNFANVEKWGHDALYGKNKNESAVELFKLYLGKLQNELKPKLPAGLDYKKAIIDYLRELGKLIMKTVNKKWPAVDFTENVLFVLTIPAEYSEKEQAIMRECVHDAKLIEDIDSPRLQFTTEPEAAAIYCMDKLKEYDLLTVGTTFMIVDCGGGTVDLTTRKLLGNQQLGEITERIGDFCGSTFIDREFKLFLCRKLGLRAISFLSENYPGQLQRMVKKFCRRVKIPFTGDDPGFHYELEVDECAPSLLEHVSKEVKEAMEAKEWVVDIRYNDVKKWFDHVIDRIIRMIHVQLSNSQKNGGTCSAIFLVGGFSESIYLQKRIKQEFQDKVKTISVPTEPVAAVVRGAAMYGLSLKNLSNEGKKQSVISTRTLKYTYGIKVLDKYDSNHSIQRRVFDDKIYLFSPYVKRGTEVKVDQEFISKGYTPLDPSQTNLTFELFKTPKYNAKYCDEIGVEPVGTLRIDLPNVHLARNRSVTFGFSFGEMEITAFARNESNGQNFQTKFYLHRGL